jgi:hypothetical protein
MNRRLLILGLLVTAIQLHATELVRLDGEGVIRWTADDREVALFGANYCLPSASDYRAAGYVGADRKKLVEQDFAHFARMGWDAVRLCLWGDWENSDKDGNLIVNDHLDVMDYAIAEAKKRGVYILFTPITTYSAWWPDAQADTPYAGFSKHFQKSELGTNPAAIAAQVNYLRQMMNHVNPYTGVALKDEPQILFVEMINEPHHHADDLAGSVAYINALAEAVRSTGCSKILFHNISQDMRITPAVLASTVPGVTFAWYPTGLNLGRELRDNHLRSVDDFTPMHRADLRKAPKLVYEFDSADLDTGYMYPAMIRAFRGVGAQFAAMFSYDMLATAPYNLGWQTHFLNLVYSPKKAMSAVISAEVMRVIPRYADYGGYPGNRHFGPVRVSYEEDSSELVTDETFLYANSTHTAPPAPARLHRIAGTGSSPIVSYEGSGAYFLDRLAEGVWRVEVYPDAVAVLDPFAQKQQYQAPAIRLLAREWPMTVRLPDLGETYTISQLNVGNSRNAQATSGRFTVSPGVYLLSRDAAVDLTTLPDHVGQVGLREFVCPEIPPAQPQILSRVRARQAADHGVGLDVDVLADTAPTAVTLHYRSVGVAGFETMPLPHHHGLRYRGELPAGRLPAGSWEYFVTAEVGERTIRLPAGGGVLVSATAGASEPLRLFDAEVDIPSLVYTRIGDTVRRGIFKALPAEGADPAALRLMLPLSMDKTLDDYTASLDIKDRINDRRPHLAPATKVAVRVRASADGPPAWLTLVEADGTSWTHPLILSAGWQDLEIPFTAWQPALGVKLPMGYPERWNYWLTPASGRGGPGDGPQLANVERFQISLRPTTVAGKERPPVGDSSVDVAWVELRFSP